MKHALIVDDDGVTRLMCQKFLAVDYQVQAVKNVDEAMALWKSQKFDLMLLDMNMPGTPPKELVKWVRVNQPGCAIVTMSASPGDALGGDDHIGKPFGMAPLLSAVKACVAKRASLKPEDSIFGKTILVAEDEPAMLDYLSKAFTAKGALVLETTRGQEALRMAQADKPDLVFLDVNLPDLSGLEVCLKIKADKNLNASRVIIMTAKTGPEIKAKAAQIGADHFVVKPITTYEFSEIIKRFLK